MAKRHPAAAWSTPAWRFSRAGWPDRRFGEFRLPHRRTAQRPERDAAAEIEQDRQQEGEAVAAEAVENPSRAPGAGGGADATADRNDAEDRAELAAGKEVGGLGGERRASGAPGQAEK